MKAATFYSAQMNQQLLFACWSFQISKDKFCLSMLQRAVLRTNVV